VASLETIFDFEENIESSLSATLSTATGISVFTSIQDGYLTTPRIDLRFELGEANEPITFRSSTDSTLDYKSYNGSFQIAIVTDNAKGETASHKSIRRDVRVAMRPYNSATFSGLIYDIKYLRPLGTTYEEDDDFNVSILPYSVVLGIRDDSWPS
jgi:hypothetical protein